MTDIYDLARKDIVEMEAYSSARSIVTKADVFLDANENPLVPDLDCFKNLPINRYPEPQPADIKKNLSILYKTPIENIFMGRGSDDAIDALLRVFCNAGQDNILVCSPTYGMYEVAAKIQGAGITKIPLNDDFDIDNKRILNNFRSNVKLVFLCSPNNPTANLLNKENIIELCKTLKGKAIVVVDEAYIEFSLESQSLIEYIEENNNLVVLRTFSKAFSLAGARFGVAIATSDIISLMNKVRAPYPLSTPSIIVIQKMLDYILSTEGSEIIKNKIKVIIDERNRLINEFSNITFIKKIYKSDSNFILIKVNNSIELTSFCKAEGIIIRDRSKELNLENCVRISIGTAEENNKLLKCFTKWSTK